MGFTYCIGARRRFPAAWRRGPGGGSHGAPSRHVVRCQPRKALPFPGRRHRQTACQIERTQYASVAAHAHPDERRRTDRHRRLQPVLDGEDIAVPDDPDQPDDNRGAAARLLGLKRTTLVEKLKRLNGDGEITADV